MTGRNEPCPCGSGKKHKKCCGRPKEIHELIDEELQSVMEGAVNEGLGHREHNEISERITKWSKELTGLFDEQLIETLAFETYMYIERQELWRRFLIRQVNTAQRPQVRDVLTAWQQPFIALGKVTANDGFTLTLQDEVSKQLYTIAANAYRGTAAGYSALLCRIREAVSAAFKEQPD
ncbi:SEC-C metal-binding domain-containing protein [Planococcus lenghuensis]|uniref:SEC-C motif-containing protein n=1 Tax=Planococcus lenghuensis TaxID=2213202 RepID=A0A1Q2L0S8_9BACL|nr:SEC-C metal-binding domain-containing protein [Planococcus lenghuensis]AQQ54039.1 hypothetical protein B0X71_13645 [Planococcus lenghuensis]